MRSLSILALTLALGSALNVEAGKGPRPKRNWQPCGGFDGCDLGDTSVQDLMNSTDDEADGDVTAITCRDLHRVWKENCDYKVSPWNFTNECMVADTDNSGDLDATEIQAILDVRAVWPDEADPKCKCGKYFKKLANDDGVLSGDDLDDFAAKKCWANNDFLTSDANDCDEDDNGEITWAEAECLCEGLETEVDDEEDDE